MKGKKSSIDDAIKSSIITKNKIKNVEINKRKIGNKIHATIICSGYIKPCKKLKSETKNIVVNIRKRLCEDCIKLSGGYYEAIIQIRGEQKDRILKKINNMYKKNLITSINKTEHGYDIRFVDKNDATIIANRLRKKHDVNASYIFVGEKKGKKLYRNVYAVR
jgi:NMD protein affecting ribosome stability and mRNA decay